MKRLIFLFCFLAVIPTAQARNFTGKFVFTFKGGSNNLLDDLKARGTYIGSQINYFLDDQILIGLSFDYSRYHEGVHPTVELRGIPEYLGSLGETEDRWEWFSFGVSGKFLADTTRFTPFIKAGVGIYIPKLTEYSYTYWFEAESPEVVKMTGKTCPGYNVGIGFQYRVWKGLGLQLEGTINHIFNRAKEISSNRSFLFANLDAGISVIF